MDRNIKASTKGYETTLRGVSVLASPLLNKGVAFSEEERKSLGLIGLLPPTVLTLDQQANRAYKQFATQPTDLEKYVYLSALHDRNEVLYYRLLNDHLREILPIVYTPTVGLAIQRFSHEYRRPRGVYLSITDPDGIEEAFRNFGAGPDDVDLIVATDSEGILGIGDWGVGGINISIGKLSVYTAAAGIDPRRVIPIVVDVGTDNQRLLNDPFYIGYRHSRIRDQRYDDFMDAFVAAVTKCYPSALLHWEDLGPGNARRILNKYRNEVCTFNDDIQGTGAVSLAAVLAAVRASGIPLRNHRVTVFGAGSAGMGIADQIVDAMIREGLSKEEALGKVWCIDRQGLLTENMDNLRDFQKPYARKASEVESWEHSLPNGGISLAEVVRRVHPSILVGTSTVAGAFSEEIVREMATHVKNPVILPMSNPTSHSEASPADLLQWTEGRVLVATGSPYEPVHYQDTEYVIAQSNNALVFPGIGLGTIVCRARIITDNMFEAAARAVARMVDLSQPGAPLLPQMEDLRAVSATVAVEVVKAAMADGVARVRCDNVIQAVQTAMWHPVYKPIYAK